MSKINKTILAILALLLTVGIVSIKAENEEGVTTWFHGPVTGTATGLPSNEGAVIYGIQLSSTALVNQPFIVTFYSTNTVTGAPTSATRLWEVALTSHNLLTTDWGTPPKPIRAGAGFAYTANDGDAVFTIFFQKRR